MLERRLKRKEEKYDVKELVIWHTIGLGTQKGEQVELKHNKCIYFYRREDKKKGVNWNKKVDLKKENKRPNFLLQQRQLCGWAADSDSTRI